MCVCVCVAIGGSLLLLVLAFPGGRCELGSSRVRPSADLGSRSAHLLPTRFQAHSAGAAHGSPGPGRGGCQPTPSSPARLPPPTTSLLHRGAWGHLDS